MRTCVIPSTDLSHLSRAQPALMITLCSLSYPASAGVDGRGPFELPQEPWVFPTCPFHTCSFGSPLKELEQGCQMSRWRRSELWVLG